MFNHWKDGEYDWCARMVANQGDSSVGYAPAIIAQYLRLQSSSACDAGEYEASARLATAATAISESADNRHAPNWTRALRVMTGES